MNSIRSLFVAVLLAAGPLLAAAPAPELLVEAPPELAAVAREVRSFEADDFSAALLLTGLTGFSTPIRVVLVPETSPLAQEVPKWVSGYARGTESLIVLFPARVRSYPDRNLRALLHHEVAHVLVARAARGRPVPRWFNEGVATVAAREWGIEDRARFAAAVIGGKTKKTADLDRLFQGSDAEVRRAYALSAAFVRSIQRDSGTLAPASVLRGVGRGLKFKRAFLEATGIPLGRAEQTFFEKDAFWNTWLPFLTSTGALWMAVTLLALVAIQRRRVRSRKMIEEWEEEEAFESVGRPPTGDDEFVN
ncbi:MAG: hypothetical protein QNL88_09425 [Acidobacteriota bacterium]|nr:hypothetical protein [Acidobacteriota bacterium]